jgi:hypothetical protein
MKRAIAVAAVLAVAGLFVVSVANAQFGGIKVPTSVSDVADAPKDVAYDSCNTWANGHKDNVKFNSTNIKGELGKDCTNQIVSKDWQLSSASNYDKENKNFELRCDYQQFAELKVNCNKEKCSAWCNRK